MTRAQLANEIEDTLNQRAHELPLSQQIELLIALRLGQIQNSLYRLEANRER